MKIEVNKEKFQGVVDKAQRITGKNVTLPILKCIKLEAEGNNLIIRATNLDLGIEIKLPVKILEKGVVAIPGQILYSFLTNLPENSNITIESIEGNIKISGVNTSTVIKSFSTEDFPVIPKVADASKFTLPSYLFVNGLKSVWWSAAVSSMKPELSSVYIYSDGEEVVFAATDSFRLAEKRVYLKNIPDFGTILLPVKNIPEIVKILEEIKDDVLVELGKNQISLTFNGIHLTSRVIDGVFPDYKQIIPKDHKTEAILLKQDLVNTLKLASVFSDKFNQIHFSLEPKTKKMEVTTKNSDIGENEAKLKANLSGESVDINVVYKYISDSFQSIDADSLTLQFNGLGRPIIIRGVGDGTFMYLVMPMNK